MTEDVRARLREKDRAVLRNISEGNDDVQKITSSTTLENHHVTYSFKKLEELELVTVTKPDGVVERVVDGQKRVFQAPKKAELTSTGEKVVTGIRDEDRFEDLSRGELVEKVHGLESKVQQLQDSLNMFQRQMQQELEEIKE